MAGFYYGFELAQGLFCLGLPMSFTSMINLRLSRRFAVKQPTGEALTQAMLRTRFWIQVIAMVSIFVTALYGMYHNLNLPLGF